MFVKTIIISFIIFSLMAYAIRLIKEGEPVKMVSPEYILMKKLKELSKE